MSFRLDGRRVLVTREADRARTVAAAIDARGGTCVSFPTIATYPPVDPAPLRAAAARLSEYDWVALSSRTGVAALVAAAEVAGAPLTTGGRPRYAAVGVGTAGALLEAGIPGALVPERQDADGMLVSMLAAGAGEACVLIVRAEAGRDVLADGLRAAGARVDFVVAYRTASAQPSRDDLAALAAAGRLDAALFMSPSSFHGWVGLLGDAALTRLEGVFVVAIGDVTARAMRSGGRPADAVAHEPTIEAMLDLVASGLATRESGR